MSNKRVSLSRWLFSPFTLELALNSYRECRCVSDIYAVHHYSYEVHVVEIYSQCSTAMAWWLLSKLHRATPSRLFISNLIFFYVPQTNLKQNEFGISPTNSSWFNSISDHISFTAFTNSSLSALGIIDVYYLEQPVTNYGIWPFVLVKEIMKWCEYSSIIARNCS